MKYSSDIKKSQSDSLITINSCGERYSASDSHIRRYTGRNDYQLIYISEGYCSMMVNDSLFIAYAGDCILYRPGETQDYFYSKRARTHSYWIHFNGSVCEELFKILSLDNAHIIQTGKSREIEHLVSNVCKYYNLKVPNRELICSGMMQSVLALLSNKFNKENDSPSKINASKISELIGHIKTVHNLNITVAQCANFCNMSESHFTRVFKNTTGMPPLQFMLNLRIDRAKELLDFTDMSIGEIAEASGFNDQNYFARTFKKITGMTPSQYRNAF